MVIQLNFLLRVFSCILYIVGVIYQPSILTHHRYIKTTGLDLYVARYAPVRPLFFFKKNIMQKKIIWANDNCSTPSKVYCFSPLMSVWTIKFIVKL